MSALDMQDVMGILIETECIRNCTELKRLDEYQWSLRFNHFVPLEEFIRLARAKALCTVKDDVEANRVLLS